MSSRSPLSLFEYEHTCAVTQSSVDYSFTINIKASGLMSQSCVFGVHGVLRVLVSWRQSSEGKAIELFFHPSLDYSVFFAPRSRLPKLKKRHK